MKGSTTEKKVLAIVVAMNLCHLCLHGKQFTISTSHKPLNWLLKLKKLTGKFKRWAMLLQSYNFDIHHTPGKTKEYINVYGKELFPITINLKE